MGFFFILLVNLLKKNLEGYIFKIFVIPKKLGWTSGFRATDDLPLAHWDETDFSDFSSDFAASNTCQF